MPTGKEVKVPEQRVSVLKDVTEELRNKEKEIALIRSEMILKMKDVFISKVSNSFSIVEQRFPMKMPAASNNAELFLVNFQNIAFSILVAANVNQCIIELFDSHEPEKYFNKKEERWSTIHLRANRPHLFRMEYLANDETFFDTQNPIHHAERFSQNTMMIRKIEDVLFEVYKEVHLEG